MSSNEPFATVKLSKLKKVISVWENIKCKDEDTDITLEYLIISCFPDLWKKFQDKIKDQYTFGYIAGVKDTEERLMKKEKEANEDKGNN